VNRNDLRDLADLRLQEAKALINKRLYDGAYYLTGYAVELGLKSCIAKKTQRYDFPDKRIVIESYSHDLNSLVKVSGLQAALEAEMKRDGAFQVNWAIVKDWNEGSRYSRNDSRRAKGLYAAVTDPRHGVLRWLRRHW
jgi:HEPN domain-containing protein